MDQSSRGLFQQLLLILMIMRIFLLAALSSHVVREVR